MPSASSSASSSPSLASTNTKKMPSSITIEMNDLSPPPSYSSRASSLSSPLPHHDTSHSSFYIPSRSSEDEIENDDHERRSSILISKRSSLMPSRRRLSTRTRIAVIITTTLSFIIFFRRHLIALALILNCYITWPFSPPPLLKVDIPNLPLNTPSTQPQFIPRNIHHVLLGPLSHNPPADWLAARNSCITMHSSWDNHYFWTDDNADPFFEENYPWFIDTWNSYPSIVQRADALRYFVLHKFGGVFLDMDLFCRSPLDGLVSYLEAVTPRQHRRPQGGMYILAESGHPHMLLAPKANPVGVSNGFIIASRGHPLLSQMVTFLPRFNLNFVLSYATVMFSTGCMYISSHMQLFTRRRWGKGTVFVLDGVENMLNGNVDTPLFRHLGTSSWHEGDAKFIRKIVGGVRKSPVGMGWIVLFLVLFFAAVMVYRRRGGRTVRIGFRKLLRRVSAGDHEDDA